MNSLITQAEKFSNLAWKASQSRTALASNFSTFKAWKKFQTIAENAGYMLKEYVEDETAESCFQFCCSIIDNEAI